MTPQELLLDAISSALPADIPVRRIRIEQSDDPHGFPVPCVLWATVGGLEPDELLSAPGQSFVEQFEVECRSETADGAATMAGNIIGELSADSRGGRLATIGADYDEPDDDSQQRSSYFAHVLEVGISSG